MSKPPAHSNGEKVAVEIATEAPQDPQVCGIVMPISAIDGCSEQHWRDVKAILSDAIVIAGFKPNLVSEAEDVGVIQGRIVENLYENPVVVCDISAKNPNVMFELGLRLAFDKPTILVKDNLTTFPFDTGQIEHLQYPRDLRFGDIVDFKERLAGKIRNTVESSKKGDYTTFLKHFKRIKVSHLETKEVSGIEFLTNEVQRISSMVAALHSKSSKEPSRGAEYMFPIPRGGDDEIHDFLSKNWPGPYRIEQVGNTRHLAANFSDKSQLEAFKSVVGRLRKELADKHATDLIESLRRSG